MTLNLTKTEADIPWVPRAAIGREVSILTDIYEPEANIAVWQRPQNPALNDYATQWLSTHPTQAVQSILTVQNAKSHLQQELPELKHKDDFQNEVLLLINMIECLFDVDAVGLRITPLTAAMCPRFHVDKIPCRMVTTYAGLGTEWLPEDNLDRQRLGKGAKGLPDHESGIFLQPQDIQQLASQEVALLKGSAWEGNEHHGLVHRSPHLKSEQSRLLLTIDY